MLIQLDHKGSVPFYRQICIQVEALIASGELAPGDMLPSMNQLAIQLGISRETSKKAYGKLLREGVLIARQGKGFFVAQPSTGKQVEILVLLDKQSVYKQLFLQSFQEELAGRAHITILLHNQNLDLLEFYLDRHLDQYDYYVVSPHFALDAKSQARAAKLLRRIPNRKLIMVDNWLPNVPGNYGVVYQDFRHDVCSALMDGREDIIRNGGRLKVMLLPHSLYGGDILKSVADFAGQTGIRVSVFKSVPPSLERGDVVLLLGSQLDSGLVDLSRRIGELGLVAGEDVRIISYNEFPINEVVLGGLTTVSTDFPAMGRSAAQMILEGRLSKIHNPFRLIRRKTF